MCGAMLLLLAGTSCRATIGYEISLARADQHLFEVTIEIPDVHGSIDVAMAAWNALYQVRDFSSHVEEVSAYANGAKTPIQKLDKQTWRVTGSGTVEVRYETYWNEPGPFASQANGAHAFVNPAMVLMYLPERREENVTLTLRDLPQNWKVATTLDDTQTRTHDGGVLVRAESFDALADSPIEAGTFEMFELPGIEPTVRVVIDGNDWKKGHVVEALKRICTYETSLMGGAPYRNYTFFYHIGDAEQGAGGGMEHSNGTAIGIPSDEYLPGVSAHEFFHLWNVKRIRPASQVPVDYTKEQYTRALWFAEGFTNTYGSYALVRSGIWDKAKFYADLGQQIESLQERPAYLWQSAEQSSLDAWLEKYALYNRPENSVSYYTKGQILGVLLDILIRDRTDDEKSLDDVMRLMNEEYGKTGKPYEGSRGVEQAVEQVSGQSFDEFFQDYVSGTKPLPYGDVLPLAGLELKSMQFTHGALGFEAERDANGVLVVQTIEPGSGADKAGLRPGDTIVEWNGEAPPKYAAQWAEGQDADTILRLRVQRHERMVALDIALGKKTETLYQLGEAPHATKKAKAIREGLLHGTTEHAGAR